MNKYRVVIRDCNGLLSTIHHNSKSTNKEEVLNEILKLDYVKEDAKDRFIIINNVVSVEIKDYIT